MGNMIVGQNKMKKKTKENKSAKMIKGQAIKSAQIIQEENKDDIPKSVYQRVRKGKEILTNAEQLFKSENYKLAYNAYKQGCNQILDVAEMKQIPKFYRDELRQITQITMKKVHQCKDILKLMSPSISSASPPSDASLGISDAMKKTILQQKK